MVGLDEIAIKVVDGWVEMISILFTCPIYALCVVLRGIVGRVPYCCHGQRMVGRIPELHIL